MYAVCYSYCCFYFEIQEKVGHRVVVVAVARRPSSVALLRLSVSVCVCVCMCTRVFSIVASAAKCALFDKRTLSQQRRQVRHPFIAPLFRVVSFRFSSLFDSTRFLFYSHWLASWFPFVWATTYNCSSYRMLLLLMLLLLLFLLSIYYYSYYYLKLYNKTNTN